MNFKQNIAIAAGSVLLLLSGFLPVWSISSNGLEYMIVRRHLYTNSNSIFVEINKMDKAEQTRNNLEIRIDYDRMRVEWCAIVLLTIGVVLLLKKRHKKNTPFGFGA